MIDVAKPIGGFFEIEIGTEKARGYHEKAIALSTGRACINLILEHTKPSRCYVPYYSCDAAFEPFEICGIDYEFYGIDKNLNPVALPDLAENEYFFYINYFGTKQKTVAKLIDHYSSQLIIDDTHNFFHHGYPGLWSFTSARKYFGVPDGAYLYTPMEIALEYERFTKISIEHSVLRSLGLFQEAYKSYVNYERTLNSEIKKISIFSERLLGEVDYESVARARRSNFQFYDETLSEYNTLSFDLSEQDTPFCYPFLPAEFIDKSPFHRNNYFIPSFWSDVIKRGSEGFDTDFFISKNLFPLPVDHRYGPDDLLPLIEFLTKKVRAHEK